MIERAHLNILREIERTGTLTQASAALNLTQSALSHSVKKLEQQLGTAVWQKEGRQLRLTQAGQALLALAHRVLPQFEQVELQMAQIACGQQGSLRIGMECHPCYQWLLTVVADFLVAFPRVDIDVRQAFQFGGMAALANYDIDLLVTPDPIKKTGFIFTPVFDYELVLVMAKQHPLASEPYLVPEQLSEQTLLTYPVAIERLDIFSQFLIPANIYPKHHKVLETTEILLHMAAAKRGVTPLPQWLLDVSGAQLPLVGKRLGPNGLQKSIYLGIREADQSIDYLQQFIQRAQTEHVRGG
ncbi:MAG TPA: LysR family transcriptional regulator [Marinagarivorans sp.]